MKKFERLGQKHETNTGTLEIIEYFNAENVTVRFDDGTILKKIQYSNIIRNGIKNPNFIKFQNRVGEKWKTNNSGSLEIIEYFDRLNVTVKFDDGTILKNIQYVAIEYGNIKNPNNYQKSKIFDLFFIGNGKYNSINNVKFYSIWKSMYERCYSINKQPKTYVGCIVDEKWYNFQNFAQWCEENYVEDFDLDKDILIKGNKVYSENTCCFVPHLINSQFAKANEIRGTLPIGVCKRGNKYSVKMSQNMIEIYLGRFNSIDDAFKKYKFEKEKYIKKLALEYKNLLKDNVFNALNNYIVEITD